MLTFQKVLDIFFEEWYTITVFNFIVHFFTNSKGKEVIVRS